MDWLTKLQTDGLTDVPDRQGDGHSQGHANDDTDHTQRVVCAGLILNNNTL